MSLSKSWGRTFIGTGVVQLVLALLLVIFTFVIYADFIRHVLLAPVYAGFPYLLPGVVGITVGFTRQKSSNECYVIISMVLNIVMSIFMFVLGVFMTLASAVYRLSPPGGDGCEDTYYRAGCRCERGLYNFAVRCSEVDYVGNLIAVVASLCYLCCFLSMGVSILGCAHACCKCCPSSSEDGPTMAIPMDTPENGGSQKGSSRATSQ